jgi:hypothetical protein
MLQPLVNKGLESEVLLRKKGHAVSSPGDQTFPQEKGACWIAAPDSGHETHGLEGEPELGNRGLNTVHRTTASGTIQSLQKLEL